MFYFILLMCLVNVNVNVNEVSNKFYCELFIKTTTTTIKDYKLAS